MSIAKMDLRVDHVYGGSRKGNASDDPLPKLLGLDCGAAFRHLGKRPGIDTLKLLALKSNFNDSAGLDHLDTESGLVITYKVIAAFIAIEAQAVWGSYNPSYLA